MTYERLKHINAFLESQRHLWSIGTDGGPANPDAPEDNFSPIGLHIKYSYELAAALEGLMRLEQEDNAKTAGKSSEANYLP
jgi:hypothetical protein